MLHSAVVLYRRTITFSYIVSTYQSRLHIPTVGDDGGQPALEPSELPRDAGCVQATQPLAHGDGNSALAELRDQGSGAGDTAAAAATAVLFLGL